MPQISIEGFDVPVSPQTSYEVAPFGDVGRAFSGRQRSDVRAHHRVFRITTTPLALSDAIALRTILQSPGPLECSGDMIGLTADFHARGVRLSPLTAEDWPVTFELHETADFASSPLLFSFDGDAEGSYTFTRTGTAYYIDSDGVLQSAATDEARFSWPLVGGVRTPAYLGERSATNLVTSDDIENGWSLSGAAVTASVDDPAGGTDAFTVADDSGAAAEYAQVGVTFTGNGVKSAVFVVREGTMPASGVQQLRVRDVTAGTDLLTLNVTAWTNGEPTVTAANGTHLRSAYIGNGYWAVYGRTTTATASNTNVVRILPADTIASTGTIDVYRVNVYNATTPPVSILDASGVLGADLLQIPIWFAPQALTIYSKWIEGGTAYLGATGPYWWIGNSSSETRLILYSSSSDGALLAQFVANGASPAQSSIAGTIEIGDMVETRVVVSQVAGSWQIQLHHSVNGAAEVSSTSATIGPSLPSEWDEDTFTIGADFTGAAHGIAEHFSHKVVAGTKTLAEMRSLASARLHPRTR